MINVKGLFETLQHKANNIDSNTPTSEILDTLKAIKIHDGNTVVSYDSDGVLPDAATTNIKLAYLKDTGYFKFNNGTWDILIGSLAGTIETPLPDWEITAGDVTYDNVSLDTASIDATMESMIFSRDGRTMYTTGSTNDRVYKWNLTTAHDISTASNSGDYGSGALNPIDFVFSKDGTKAYFHNAISVKQYSMTTAFDVTTLTDDSSQYYYTDTGLSGGTAYVWGGSGIYFTPTGNKYFVCGNQSDAVHEITCSTPFDISTSSKTYTFSVATQNNNPRSVWFSNYGTQMFVSDATGDAIYIYTLTTGFDLSTASYSNTSIDVSGQTAYPDKVRFSSDGTKMYIMDNNEVIYQYSTGL